MQRLEVFDFRPICGIYKIEHKETGKVYIGQSKHIIGRLAEHTRALALGNHSNKPLLNAFQRDGYNAFFHEILEECSPEDILAREFHYMVLYRERLYNTGNVARLYQ